MVVSIYLIITTHQELDQYKKKLLGASIIGHDYRTNDYRDPTQSIKVNSLTSKGLHEPDNK